MIRNFRDLHRYTNRIGKRAGRILILSGLSMWLLCACKNPAAGSDNTTNEPVFFHAAVEEEVLKVAVAHHDLLTDKGVKVSADSQLDKDHMPKLCMDGDEDTFWTSENNWEEANHFLQVEFKKAVQVSAVRILWERNNVRSYVIEVPNTAGGWESLYSFHGTLEKTEQYIDLATRETSSIRIHVTEVSKEEENTDLYYQNVGIRELQIFDGETEEFEVYLPMLEAGTDREIPIPTVPEGYSLKVAGINYENLQKNDRFADTICDVNIQLGYKLYSDNGWSRELPGFDLCLPASDGSVKQEFPMKEAVSVREWKAAGEEASFYEVGDLESPNVEECITPNLTEDLGEEGYELTILPNRVLINAGTARGICYGNVTLRKMLNQSHALPVGTIRDYPEYAVRGFNIDVGRRPISMEFLYRVVDAMEMEKMNTLQVHLNDNVILTNHMEEGTVENARSLYSGFRLESNVRNEDGDSITSEDFYYSSEEFAALVAYGTEHGVDVVPEIDTPAHSMAILTAFPQLGFQGDDWRMADKLDISKEETRDFIKGIWREYLEGDSEQTKQAAFADCRAVHLGMDEYFGDKKDYNRFLTELANTVKGLAPGKELRVWASTKMMESNREDLPKDVAMMIWSGIWDDPQALHDSGFKTINCLNTNLYIIVGGGEGESLNLDYLKETWEPNVYKDDVLDVVLPKYSERVLGAMYSMWNDGYVPNGDNVSEEELFNMFEEPLSVLADKLW